MKLFNRSSRILSLALLSFLFIVFMQNSYANTTLEVTTTNMGDTMYFSYQFNFSDSSPSSIIAIEKPEDSIFVNAYDSEGVEYEPLVIGDFYRFELNNRDISSYKIDFTSSKTLRDVYEKDEQLFYVNSNLDIDSILVNFDVIRNYEEVLDVYPRNFEVNDDETVITTIQEGSLNDNLFRINYEATDSMSIWIIVLLSIPILFFVILYISLKVKPVSRDKTLGEYIKNDSQDSNNLTINSNESINEDSQDNIVYSFGNEDYEVQNQKINDDEKNNNNNSNKTEKVEKENTKNKINSKAEEKEISGLEENLETDSTNENYINNSELEEYIQKYFTENEQDVIRVISKNEGLMQQEILDNLPIFTKSTLSKILSKLEKKKMIERVRVGKVNKLFIGEELKKLIKNEKEEDKNEEEEEN